MVTIGQRKNESYYVDCSMREMTSLKSQLSCNAAKEAWYNNCYFWESFNAVLPAEQNAVRVLAVNVRRVHLLKTVYLNTVRNGKLTAEDKTHAGRI